MSEKLRWGIISTARINRRLIPAIRTANRSRLVGLAGRDPAHSRNYAARWEIGRVWDSYQALLESDEVDAVYLPLPNSLHSEWVLRALAAGKHVLCEKPLALHAAEVREMEAAAREADLVLMEAMAYRLHPQYLRLRELVLEGELGRLRLIRAHYAFTLPEDSGNIRLDPALGGGCLYDIGVYPLSFALGLDPSRVEEATATFRSSVGGVDTICCGRLLFASGVLAQFDVSFRMPYRVGAEVIGEEGRLIVPNPWQPDLDGKPSGLIRVLPDDREEIISTEKVDPYLAEVRAMEEAVLDFEPAGYPLKESRRVAGVIDRLKGAAGG